MSEIQEAVRERYAAKANEIAKKARGTVTVGALELSCSLTETELAKRRAEWLALDGALLRREERPGVVETTYRGSPQTRSRLERLVAAERDCCADARWSLQDEGSTLRVRVEASAPAQAATCGCGADCCATASAETATSTTADCCAASYSAEDLATIGLDPTASLGCGNPTLLADLHPGETVLDLGSGAGIDVLLSARRVSPGGHAYGVDMTDEMVGLAQDNQARSGVLNATFLKGTIESVPLPDASVDVVISNCVINLAADKPAVLREAHRVLRPGGRFAVADMVALRELPAETKARLDAWAGCVAGTITIDEYTAALRGAGFGGVDVEVTDRVAAEGAVASAYIRAVKPAA